MANQNHGISLNRVSLAATVQLLVVFGGLPAIAIASVLLWRSDWSPIASGSCTLMIVAIWVGCIMAARERVLFPLRTLSNLLAALREGDYSLRAASARRADVLGEVMRELNGLSQALQTDRQQATETNALLLAVISNIDLAVFTFDQENRLRLVNDAGIRLLNRRSEEILGSTAVELGLEECLQGNRTGVLQRSFAGSFGTRWEIRRSAFRQEGRPHQLLVLADLSQTLREEERRAWQRLIRVLGHELNNSLGPIQSISDSLSFGCAPIAVRTFKRVGVRSHCRARRHSGPHFGARAIYGGIFAIGSAAGSAAAALRDCRVGATCGQIGVSNGGGG
jgi:two-component system, NtrC family, nitrogen regulation sensor histidine kinase NtrY